MSIGLSAPLSAGNVYVGVRVGLDRLHADLAAARRELDRWSSRSIVARLAVAPVNVATALAKAGAVGGAGVAGVAGVLATQASAMEDRFARLRRVTGLQGAEFEKLAGRLKGIASATAGVSLDDVFGTATMAAKLGVQGPALASFTRDMLKFSTALEGMDLESAVEQTARIMSVFRAGADQAGKFASALVSLDTASTASAADILNITQRAAPMARTMGMSAAATMSLAAALRQSGSTPEVAGSALSTILGRMAERGRQPAFARAAGMDRRAFAGLMRADPLEAVKAMAAGVSRMDPGRAMEALKGMGLASVRTRQGVLGLASVLPTLDQYLAIANREFGTAAALESAMALKAGTASAQLQLMYNNLKLAAGELGEGLLPILKGFAAGIVDLMGDARRAIEANRATLVSWGERAGHALRYVGVLWRAFPTFIELAWVRFQEFGDRSLVVMDRIGIVFGNGFKALGDFLGSWADRVGPHIWHRLVKGLADQVPDFALPLIAKLDKDLAAGIGMFKFMAGGAMPPMPNAADFFNRKRMMEGLGPQGVFGGLPDRNLQAKPLEDRLRGARQGMLGEQAAARAKDADEERRAGLRAGHARAMGDFLRKNFGVAGGAPGAMPQAPGGAGGIVEQNRRARAEANRKLREERDRFNQMMRPGRHRGPGGVVPPLGEAPMPGPAKPPGADEGVGALDKESVKLLATNLGALNETLTRLGREGIPALFG